MVYLKLLLVCLFIFDLTYSVEKVVIAIVFNLEYTLQKPVLCAKRY